MSSRIAGYVASLVLPPAFVIAMVATNFFQGRDYGHIGSKRLPLIHQSLFSEALMMLWTPILGFVFLYGAYGLAAELFGRSPDVAATAGRGAAFVVRVRAIPLVVKLLLGIVALPFLFPQVRRATTSRSLALRAVTVFVIPWTILFIVIGIPSMLERRRDFLEHRSSYGP